MQQMGFPTLKTIYIGHTGHTPLGDLWVAISEHGLLAIQFPATQASFTHHLEQAYAARIELAPEKLQVALTQLREYAAGARKEFNLPIDWSIMGEFQRKALQATLAIPYGETRTYKDIAVAMGQPNGARAVGRAEATNPLPIVLPCHRVVGTDHKLHGYGAGAGLETKSWLLTLEGARLE